MENAAAISVVTQHLCCIKCRYDIHGLPTAGNCPECGILVSATTSEPLLRYLGRGRLSCIVLGLRLVVIGLILAGIAMIVLYVGVRNESHWLILLFLPLMAWYSAGWWFLYSGLSNSGRVDARFHGHFPRPLLLAAAIPTVATPVLVVAIAWPLEGIGVADPTTFGLLVATCLSTGTHFLSMSAVLLRIADTIEGRKERNNASTFQVLTRAFHGICLPWALFAAYSVYEPYFVIIGGGYYLLSLPFHALWLLLAALISFLLVEEIGIERRAVGESIPGPSSPKSHR